MAVQYTLLPSLQTALAGRAGAPAAGGVRRQVRLGVQVLAGGTAHGAPHQVAGELLGAGDIASLDPSMVARVEPGSQSRAVEPNYFPYVEFVDADFPWRYTLDTGSAARLRPWLLLVALEPAEFRYLGSGGGPLPRIEVFHPATSLPDPDQCWAFAHVQVTRPDPDGGLEQRLSSSPEASFARLLCPRRLRDSTSYTLFLVPAFEAGRRTGIGLAGPAEPWNAFAWDRAAAGPAELPVYREWALRTSTLEDFESLVRRLRPLSLDAASPVGGTRTVFAGRPGYYSDVDVPDLTFEAEGALQRIGFVREQPVIERTILTPRLEQTLTAVIESDLPVGEADGPDREDPLMALPVYGRHFAEPAAIDADATATPWVHEVNLDLRLRLAAGIGARIVRRHQEQLMQSCWEQAGEVQQANRLRARLQLVTQLSQVMVDKHVQPLAVGVTAQLATPLLHTVKTPFGGDRTIRADLMVRGVPAGQASPMARRLAAKRPDFANTAAGRTARLPIRADDPFGDHTEVVPPTEDELRRATNRVEAQRVTVADTSDIAHVLPDVLTAGTITFDRPVFESGQVDAAEVVRVLVDRIRELPLRKAVSLIIGTSDAPATLEPMVRTPRVAMALSAHVHEEDINHLLPNAGEMPDNSVTVVVENRAFIEALMTGANHEMNSELRWREFPTDMRASVLTRFWASGHAPEDATGDDLLPMAQWDGHTGTHFRQGGQPSLTLLINGDLVRRYPDLLVVANRQVIPPGGSWLASRGSTRQPSFTGLIGDSTAFFGFDLTVDEVTAALGEHFFVLYEPASRFRFGLDIATYGKRKARRQVGRAPMPFPLATLDTSRRAARIRSLQAFWNLPPQPAGPVPQDPDDLSWEHVTLDDAGYIDFGRTIMFADGSDLLGPARTSASIARATLQRPISAVLPARKMFNDA